jgi:hypothetical protein
LREALNPAPSEHVASEEGGESDDGLSTCGGVHSVGEAATGWPRGWRWVQLLGVGQTGLDYLVIEESPLFCGDG